jgi:hypothetical protein
LDHLRHDELTCSQFESFGVDILNETSDPRIARCREDGYSGVLEAALATLDHRLTVRHRWVVVSFPNQQPMRQQGWKLHLSAHPGNSYEVLRLADEGVTPRPLTVSAIRRLNAMAQGG